LEPLKQGRFKMKKSWLVAVAVLVVLSVMPVLIPWSRVILILVMSKGLAVLGVLVLLRAGQVSFGHAMFFAISAYTAAFITRAVAGVDVLTIVVAGVAVSTLWGLIAGLFVVRYRYIFFAMLNLAISMVLYALLEKFYHITGGSDGLMLSRPEFFGQVMERSGFEICFYYLVLVLTIIVIYGVHRFLKAPIGHALAAIKTNETRLEYLGISARNVLLAGYVLSAALVGLGGVFNAIIQGIVTPEISYWVRSGEFIFIAILGGGGNVLGAFAGSFVYEIVKTYFAAIASGMWQMLLGIILLIIIMVAPDGLVGLFKQKEPSAHENKQASAKENA
jgi:ABC-type branched-subunit amino acid transport system permease subunit